MQAIEFEVRRLAINQVNHAPRDVVPGAAVEHVREAVATHAGITPRASR